MDGQEDFTAQPPFYVTENGEYRINLPWHISTRILMLVPPKDALNYRLCSPTVNRDYELHIDEVIKFHDCAVSILFDSCKAMVSSLQVRLSPKKSDPPREKRIVIQDPCVHTRHGRQMPQCEIERTQTADVFLVKGHDRNSELVSTIRKVMQKYSMFRVEVWNMDEVHTSLVLNELAAVTGSYGMPYLDVVTGSHGFENTWEGCELCTNPLPRRHHQQQLPAAGNRHFALHLIHLAAPVIPVIAANQVAPPLPVNVDITDIPNRVQQLNVKHLTIRIERGHKDIPASFFNNEVIRGLKSLAIRGYVNTNFDKNRFDQLTMLENIEISQYSDASAFTPQHMNTLLFDWYGGYLPVLKSLKVTMAPSVNQLLEERAMKNGLPFEGLYQEFLTTIDHSKQLSFKYVRSEICLEISDTPRTRYRPPIPSPVDRFNPY